MKNNPKVNRDKVLQPTPSFSSKALEQINLIKQHDFTLENKYFRIAIKGKECDGFTYEAYFDEKNMDDFIVTIEGDVTSIQILFDPFSAFYLKNVQVDYQIDLEENTDGFLITNPEQDLHSGKFWVKKGASKPPMV